MGFPTSTDRYSQKLLSQVIPNPVNLTVNINYHSGLHCDPVDHSSNCYDLDATVRWVQNQMWSALFLKEKPGRKRQSRPQLIL